MTTNLTEIMRRDNITKIERYIYADGTESFHVVIAGKDYGHGADVGEAYAKALAWAEMRKR